MFYCVYTGEAGATRVGPLAAAIVPHSVPQMSTPLALAVVLHCPTPPLETVMAIAPKSQHTGIAATTLSISLSSRTPGLLKLNMSFEGLDGGDAITFLGIPTPPLPPPPSAPPPPPPWAPPPPPPPRPPPLPTKELFTSSGSTKSFTVKTTDTFRIKVWGAAGASGFKSAYGYFRGGSGAYIVADCTLPYDTALTVVVGQGGYQASHAANTNSAFGGGGKSGCCNYGTPGGGGGGLSGVFSGNPWKQENALVVAGAGGGAAGAWGGNGGYGGYPQGGDSTNGYSVDGRNCHGRGGTQTSGGGGGYGGRRQNGNPGSALKGGDAGTSNGLASGGGGSGWYGGGAGAGYYCGGGGSSFVNTEKCKLVTYKNGETGSGVASSSSTASDHPSGQSDSDYPSGQGIAVTSALKSSGGDGYVVMRFGGLG